MRKILAGFMATAMVTSICATVSFAATNASFEMSFTDGSSTAPTGTEMFSGAATGVTATPNNWTLGVNYNSITVNMPNASASGAVSFDIPLNITKNYTGAITANPTNSAAATYDAISAISAQDLIDSLDGKGFETKVDGYLYTGRLAKANGKVQVKFDQAAALNLTGATVTLNQTTKETLPSFTGTVSGSSEKITDTVTTAGTVTKIAIATSNFNNGSGAPVADVETSGSFAGLSVQDVVYTDGTGNPVVMTESKNGVDEVQNGVDGVQSGNTLYFLIRDDVVEKLDDDTYWKLKITKGDNGKNIKAVSDVSKVFSKGLYPMNGTSVISATVGQRQRYIKVELNEIYTDDEIKMTLDIRLSPKSKAVNAKLKVGNTVVTDDSDIKVKDFYFYMKNIVKDADNDWRVGIGGLMLNPVANDWNEVTYYDEDGDVAFMKFFGDSDTGKFYAKLSTKWAHEDYAAYFNDQDAFYFEFTGSPKLSSTSRADLQIYNPFINSEGDETIDPSTATIYQVVDGDLIDVTDSFTYGEAENGDDAFITRTRFLGSYIICEKPVEEATGDADIDDLMPDDMETPEEVTPDNNGGGKAPANTGRYL